MIRQCCAKASAVLAPQSTSPVNFPQQREGQRALQAVVVTARRRPGDPLLDGGGGGRGDLRQYVFTFCLERVSRGPYKVRRGSLTIQAPTLPHRHPTAAPAGILAGTLARRRRVGSRRPSVGLWTRPDFQRADPTHCRLWRTAD